MAYAFEKADDDVMLRPPRRALAPRDVYLEENEVDELQRQTDLEVRRLR